MGRHLLLFLPVLLRAAEEHGADHGSSELTYKWINFAILAVALLYLMAKFLFPALKARSNAIHQDLSESAVAVEKANARVAQLTAKLNQFDGELSEMRAKAMAEREIEGQRIAAQTAGLLDKVAAQRETEIQNLTQAAQGQLRQFTVEKAIELAQSRLAAQTDPATQSALVAAFLNDLKKQEAR
jgi:F-type H+-transporting ATPase subunit b